MKKQDTKNLDFTWEEMAEQAEANREKEESKNKVYKKKLKRIV